LFPRTRKEMSGGTVSNLKKRARKHGDALYRKKRCDAGTLSALQGDALELALEHTSTTSTAELRGMLLRSGFYYLGPSNGAFPRSTIDDRVRALNHSVKRTTPIPLDINMWNAARQQAIAARYPSECFIAFDEAQLRWNESERRMGRAPVGKVAVLRQWHQTWRTTVRRSVFVVITTCGVVMPACTVVEGNVDDEAFKRQFFFSHFLPQLQKWDPVNPKPHSIVQMVRNPPTHACPNKLAETVPQIVPEYD
jgi:hypothetical protein